MSRAKAFDLGARVQTGAGASVKHGTVAFVGETQFSTGEWVVKRGKVCFSFIFFTLSLILNTAHPVIAGSEAVNPATLYSFEGAVNIFSEYLEYTLSTLTETAGLSEMCPFREGIAQSVKEILPQYIRGQDEGIEIVVNAVASWEFGRKSGKSDPLVLALTGSTGIGKSETAFRLAEAMFLKSTRVGQTRRFIPNGLLVIRGEDYSESSEAGSRGIGEVHSQIRSRLAAHLQKCDGKALVVFDEVQKISPGALDVLMPALEGQGTLTHTDSTTHKTSMYSTSQVIFVFISDIGADRMTRLLLKYQKRTAIPTNLLRDEVKQALDEQWSKLRFGKTISEVVPFLPMEQQHIQDVLALKFFMLAHENKHVYWQDLVVDAEVTEHLSSPHFLMYINHTAVTKNAPDKVNSKVFAKYGARALEVGGPLQDLKSLFFRFMRPWRPTQILHIGLADRKDVRISSALTQSLPPPSSSVEVPVRMDGAAVIGAGASTDSSSSSSSSSASTSSDLLFYLQWCRYQESMVVKSSQGKDVLRVDQSTAFSAACETIWCGDLQ